MLFLKSMRLRRIRTNLLFWILPLALAAILLAFITQQFIFSDDRANAVVAEGGHYITIYDRDEKTTLRSDAATVKEVLDRAEITVSEGDIVEPSLEDIINEDDFKINIYRAREVVTIDGLSRKYFRTAATDPAEIAKAAGIELLPEDIINTVNYSGFLESGMTIAYEIKRAKTVHFTLYGQEIEKRTQADTVADFLKEQNIESNPEINWISLPEDTKIADNIEFKVYMQGKQSFSQEETIPFTERITTDYNMDRGKSEITKAGQNGRKMVTYEIELYNGEEVNRQVISEVVIEAPVQQERTVGAKISLPSGSHEDWMAAAGISSSDYGYVNFIISHESGWRTTASNGRYFGLYQTSLGRLQAECPNWQSDPVCQLRSASNYARGRYGSWSGAYQFWSSHHWW